MARSEFTIERPRLARERGAVAVTARHYEALTRAFLDASGATIGDAEEAELTEALSRRDVRAAVQVIPDFDTHPSLITERAKTIFRRLFDRMVPVYAEIVRDAGNAQAKRNGWALEYFVPSLAVEKADYAKTRVAIDLAWVRQQAAKRVVEVTREQKQVLRQIVSESLRTDKRSTVVVRDIKRVVGLTSRELQAVANKRDKLQEQGKSPAKVDREVARYAEKLHTLRAQRIARTESVSAETQGSMAAWKDAQSDGLIEPDAAREWIASTAACDVCSVMDGQRVGLNEKFKLPDGTFVEGPPGHPNCVCGLVLRRGRI